MSVSCCSNTPIFQTNLICPWVFELSRFYCISIQSSASKTLKEKLIKLLVHLLLSYKWPNEFIDLYMYYNGDLLACDLSLILDY